MPDDRTHWKKKLFMASLFFHKKIANMFRLDLRLVLRYNPGGELESKEPRTATLELMSREINRHHVKGSTAELGVFRGDFARLINHYFPDKKLYLFDTFEGFDARDANADRKAKYSQGTQDFTQTSVELVLEKMKHPKNCIIRKVWFPETAEGVDDEFCFVSIDADLYQPILAGLEFFYPRLVHGGAIMVHDFNNLDYLGANQAVCDFCEKNNIGYVCISDLCGSAVIVK